MSNLLQQTGFVLRLRYKQRLYSFFRKLWFSCLGMSVGRKTSLSGFYITWPHQVRIGRYCILEPNISFKFDGIWKPGPSIIIGNHTFLGAGCEFNIRESITVGNDCLIASGCKFIDHNHGFKDPEIIIKKQTSSSKLIIVSNNVWLGCNVIVLQGVSIGEGAIVAAGAVVTQSIPHNEIWGGVPAKKIGQR